MVTIPNYTKGLVLKRETAQLTNFSQIEAAQAPFEAAAQVVDVGVQIGQKIKETQDMTAVNEAVIRRQKEDIDFRSEFQKSRTDKPLGYAKDIQEQYKARDKAIMESLPSEEARQAYQLSAERLNLQHYENDVSWETKQFATVSIDKAKSAVDDLAVMAYRGVPLDEIKKQRQATTMTLQGVLSPDELKKFDAQAEATYTKSYIDGIIESNPAQAKRELDSKKYDSVLDVDSLQSLTNKADKEIERIRKEAIQLQEKRSKLLVEDPAELAVMDGARTPEDIVARQQTYGVVGSNVSVLPKKDAQRLVNDFNGIKSSDEMIRALGELRSQYPDDYYNIALKDLKKNGLSEDMTFIAMMNPSADKQIMDATFAMAKEGKNYKDLSKARGIADRDITEGVEDRIEDIRDVFLNEGAAVSNLNQKLESIATYFTAQGMDVKSATQLATDWFVNKSAMGSVNGKNFRVPLEYKPDDVEDALDLVMDSIKPEDINTIGTGEFSTAALKRGSRFVLSPDESYYYLKNQVGTPVLKKNSSEILKFPIIDILENLKQSRIKAQTEREQRIYMENLLGLQEE